MDKRTRFQGSLDRLERKGAKFSRMGPGGRRKTSGLRHFELTFDEAADILGLRRTSFLQCRTSHRPGRAPHLPGGWGWDVDPQSRVTDVPTRERAGWRRRAAPKPTRAHAQALTPREPGPARSPAHPERTPSGPRATRATGRRRRPPEPGPVSA